MDITGSQGVNVGDGPQINLFLGKPPDGARTLATEVGRLPLALAQAAAVIRAQRLTYPVYLTRLRDYPTGRYLGAGGVASGHAEVAEQSRRYLSGGGSAGGGGLVV